MHVWSYTLHFGDSPVKIEEWSLFSELIHLHAQQPCAIHGRGWDHRTLKKQNKTWHSDGEIMLDEPTVFSEGGNKCGKKGKPVDLIYLDFPKTFEKTSCQRLLNVLRFPWQSLLPVQGERVRTLVGDLRLTCHMVWPKKKKQKQTKGY